MNNNNIPIKIVNNLVSDALKNMTCIYTKLKKEMYSLFTQLTFLFNLLIIYSAFIHYPSICVELINMNNQMFEFFEWSDKLSPLTLYSYPTKMIILSLCILINSDSFSKDNFKFLNLTFKYLDILIKHESCILLNKSKIRIAFLNESDNEEDDDISENSQETDSDKTESDSDDQTFNTEKEIEIIMFKTFNPLKSVDEYNEFRLAIELYKNKNPQQFALWLSSLSDCDRDKLNSILQTSRIEINNENENISIPRKIIKIKKLLIK